MKLSVWQWLAISSLTLAALLGARAETRPQYGGTLRVSIRARLTSLDPADATQGDTPTQHSLTCLIFETLVTTDQNGQVQPLLAESWQITNEQRRWQFRLRRNVRFHDGTALTPEIAAASLRMANPNWYVSADSDSVTIQRNASTPELLAELSLPRNAIIKRTSNNLDGTGPFDIADWQPGKSLTLAADENYWGGRPFLDGIGIAMGQSFRDQIMQLDLGRSDFVEVAPEQGHRVSTRMQFATSPPIELVALVFNGVAQTPDEKTLREALALSIERGSIRDVLLQGAGKPAASLLPNWMTGYGFVFSADADLVQARHVREQVPAIPTWSLAYDSNDSLARLLADRVALNAKDAGLSLRPSPGSHGDLRLVRIPLASSDPWAALASLAQTAGLPSVSRKGGSIEDLYHAEQTLLAPRQIIPLFHLPVCYAYSPAVRNLTLRPDGSFDLSDAWLGDGMP
jgi:peptide/nickel transport system substrate-binding protein